LGERLQRRNMHLPPYRDWLRNQGLDEEQMPEEAATRIREDYERRRVAAIQQISRVARMANRFSCHREVRLCAPDPERLGSGKRSRSRWSPLRRKATVP
jgi:hypothetical protein